MSTGTLNNATAIGANAEVDASNSLVLGSIAGVNFSAASTNVGIGTTAPAATLHLDLLDHGATDSLLIGNTSSKGLQFFDAGTGVDIASYGVPLYINFAGKNTYLNVTGGSVGIGTSAPDNTLTVNGSADKPGGGSWGTFSDGRLKTLRGDFTSGLEQILQLTPVRYRYNHDNALGIYDPEEHIGLVAQEVQQVIPEAVTQDGKGYLLVNNDPILWAMLNAIKQQQQQIQRQQAENMSLRGELVRLAGQMQEMRIQLQQVQAPSGHAAGN
jgi:hypothetical protein